MGYLEKIGVQVQSILWCYSVSSLPASCSAPLMTGGVPRELDWGTHAQCIEVHIHSVLRYTYTVH